MALGLALRFVLDALRKPHGSKMYYFGIAALDRFKSRLKEYQKYCEHISAIAHFNEFPHHLIEVSRLLYILNLYSPIFPRINIYLFFSLPIQLFSAVFCDPVLNI